MKVIDFGISTYINKGNNLNELKGTFEYMAPEVLLQDYDHKCDIWSCGCIAYALLVGRPPYEDL